ncbi:hypothetical protein Tco_0543159 [Tanacetum coccineum]
MSDSEDSTVTYTAVSSPFEGLSDIGSPGVDGPPMMPEDPYAYVVAAFQRPSIHRLCAWPGEPEQAPTPTKVVPESVIITKVYMPPERYNEEGEEPSVDVADDEYEEKDDEEDEEEHPALADSIPPPPVHRTTARISIPAQAPVPFLFEEEVERFLAIPTPPPSPLTPLSSPLPQIPSPPLPVSPPLPISPLLLPVSPTYPLGFRAAMIWQRAEKKPSTYTLAPPLGTPPLLPIPLPTPSPPLLLPSTDRRADMPEVCLPPQKRLCITQGPKYEVEESSSEPRPTGGFRTDYGFVATLDAKIRRDPERDVGYGITNTWDEMLVGIPGAPATDDTELGRQMTEFATMTALMLTLLYSRNRARLSREAGDDSWQLNLQAADHARHAQLVETTGKASEYTATQLLALQGHKNPLEVSTRMKYQSEAVILP